VAAGWTRLPSSLNVSRPPRSDASQVQEEVCTAREAVAWTFGLTAHDYQPTIEI